MTSVALSACSSTFSEYLVADASDWQNIYPYGKAIHVNNEIQLISTSNWFYLTKKQYADFILEVEVKMPDVKEYANSGIMFRAQIKQTDKGFTAVGYQAEVDPSKRKWSGGLYDQGRKRQWLHPVHPTRSFPDADFKQNLSPKWGQEKSNAYKHLEWNHYRIECRGEEIKIYLNGVLTTHVMDAKADKGFIGIQHHGSKQYKKTGSQTNTARFRKIKIMEL